MTLDEAMTIVSDYAHSIAYSSSESKDRFTRDWRIWLEHNRDLVPFDDIGQIKTMRLVNETGKTYSECRQILTRLGVQLRDY